MLRFTLTHDMHCTVDEYWTFLLKPGTTEAMLTEGLGYGRVEAGPMVDGQDGTKTRTTTVMPKLELPPAVARVLGPALGYTEHGVFQEEPRQWKFEIQFAALGKRMTTGGTIRIEPTPAGCRRVSELFADSKIPGLSGMMERSAQKNMTEGFDKGAQWLNRQLDAQRKTDDEAAREQR